ncbi:RNA exonuclease 4 isoform X2 [Xiphophorus hellerii]|uniref:RNA exonuclease 4 isoform X2 n=1 Tax=Xiphophorus hellerii TaxID=8084 RepID=UPI0013B3E0D1|nr:RNA exonuclease 4 isoform X2 [Xiphophorus hellerii]
MQHGFGNPTAKDKRKTFWIKQNLKKKKKKLEKQAAPQKQQEKPGPPQEAQQISANWKSLQQILKSSQSEKRPQNGFTTKKHQENAFQRSSVNTAAPRERDSGEKEKQKTVPVVPKEAGEKLKLPAASDSQQSAAPKRKKDKEIPTSEEEGPKKKKKKISLVEERKPTEDDLWFDDVDPDVIEETMGAEAAEIMRRKQGVRSKSREPETSLVKESAFSGITQTVAIDCEMVGVGPDGEESILARVSLVNKFGKCIYDKYVKPTEKVTDYRTAVSGIRPEDIKDGEDVQTVQREVADILKGRIVVGHAIHNDLKILLLDHPKKFIRDTQKYKPFRRIAKPAVAQSPLQRSPERKSPAGRTLVCAGRSGHHEALHTGEETVGSRDQQQEEKQRVRGEKEEEAEVERRMEEDGGERRRTEERRGRRRTEERGGRRGTEERGGGRRRREEDGASPDRRGQDSVWTRFQLRPL